MKRTILWLVIMLLITYCTSPDKNNGEKSRENKLAKKEEVKSKPLSFRYEYSLKSKKGEDLGKVFVKPVKEGDTVFTSLVIIKEKDTLYTIADNVLYNKKGVELTFEEDSNNKFYGYIFVLKKDDYFTLTYLSNNGVNVSDDIEIDWNDKKKIFEMFRAP